MDCDTAWNLISAQIDRAIEPADQEQLAAHLHDCAGCRATVDAWRAQDVELRRVFLPRRQASAKNAEQVIARLGGMPSSPRRRLPWLPMLASAAAGFLLAVFVFRPWQEKPLVRSSAHEIEVQPGPKARSPETDDALTLAVANRKVEVQPPNQFWCPADVGEKVTSGSHVRTGSAVRCEFHTPDGSEVRLNGDTELVFLSNRRFTLIKGQILAQVAAADSPFQVGIPDATVTALGTEFDLQCRPKETVLTVLQGSTKVEGKGPETVVRGGQAAIIVDGSVRETQVIHNLVKATEWTHELLMLKGRDNPELAQRVNDILATIGQTKMDEISEQDIRSLGDHCVLPLTRYIQSPRSRAPGNHRRRILAARLVADLAQPWSIPYLIELLSDPDGQVRSSSAQALKRLTQCTFGGEPKAWGQRSSPEACQEWQSWWKENKDRFPSGR